MDVLPHEDLALGVVRAPRVLIAEDETDIRKMVSVALRRLGYEIVEACTGPELLNALGGALLDGEKQAQPDVIISDIRLPGLTGMAVLAGLRHDHWPTAIVLMTAYADRETWEEANRLGVDAFFEKPFDIDDLVTAVVNLTPTALRLRSARNQSRTNRWTPRPA